jgi:5'-nucleotidase/UDP-sugar diphosphatase
LISGAIVSPLFFLFKNAYYTEPMKPLNALSPLCYSVLFSLGAPALHGQDMRELTVLYTNDEHGWMEGMSADQGAANLYQLWRDQEGYTEDGAFLVLSGGDNFTGPAVSTWVQGESMVEVMNAMSYDASAVGNHEFDFGLAALAQRIKQADYPYLGANIAWKDGVTASLDLGILPWTQLSVNGLDIAIIGLTTTSTPFVTNPDYVAGLDFLAYEQAIREVMPAINAVDPDLIFIISHVCMDELEPLVERLQDLEIALAGGGHCNELVAKKQGKTVILGGGFHFTSYAVANFAVDTSTGVIDTRNFLTRQNQGARADSGVADIVSRWATSFQDILAETVAWNATALPRGETLDQLIIDSWLETWPSADIAVTNRGGIRTDLLAGEITVSDLVNLLPFENTVVMATVPGRVIMQAIVEGGRPVIAGLERRNGNWFLSASGQRLAPDQDYVILLNSFMYAGGDNFGAIRDADPDAFDTGIHYRQPFQDWLKRQSSSERNPLVLP